ncbi:MAG: hypothetical protein R2695_20535 [Acidimicrobiales bacterium]
MPERAWTPPLHHWGRHLRPGRSEVAARLVEVVLHSTPIDPTGVAVPTTVIHGTST